MSTQHIMTAQQALKDAGFLGAVDGIFGKDSLDAVNAAIKATGFEPVELPEGQITANFKMSELTHSNTAVAKKLSNKPSTAHEQNLVAAAINLFQPVRELLGQPMVINSGYRSPTVNKAVGGSATSAHSIGYAIDFVCPKFGNTVKIAKFLVEKLYTQKIGFDQLILEFPNTDSTWIHLGYKNGNGDQRRQILTAKKIKGKTEYFPGLQVQLFKEVYPVAFLTSEERLFLLPKIWCRHLWRQLNYPNSWSNPV